jgi:hypothetical protein
MAIQETNVVTPLRPKTKRMDNTAAERQRRRRQRKRVTPTPTVTVAPVTPVMAPVTPDVTGAHPTTHAGEREIVTAPKRANYALVAIAYGFFLLGIGINVWNATTGGTLADMALPAALGVLAEAVLFFLPAWALTLPIGRQVHAWALFAFISVFALTNSVRMARSSRRTKRRLGPTSRPREFGRPTMRSMWRSKRDEACGPGHGKSVACKVRQAEVAKLEADQTQATANVVAQARPESSDFAKLMTWVSRGAIQPGVDDFAMLWLLFRTFLPQVGGLVLMLAATSAR